MDVADDPIIAFAPTGRQVSLANAFGVAREPPSELGGVLRTHHAASRPPIRCSG
jgi:predicted Zn-dependent protease